MTFEFFLFGFIRNWGRHMPVFTEDGYPYQTGPYAPLPTYPLTALRFPG